MLLLALVLVFVCVALVGVALTFGADEARPSLNLQEMTTGFSSALPSKAAPKKNDLASVINGAGLLLRPVVTQALRRRLVRDLGVAHSNLSPEGFMLTKLLVAIMFLIFLPSMMSSDMLIFAILIAVVAGYMLPEMMLQGQIKKIKGEMVKLLPDVVDLLGLCVSAGLDFMMALKWVVEKSPRNIVAEEMGNLLQEISVGKPRREALRDMAKKYEIADLSTFARTLIQADKMGTSVSEALNILSEDMRIARFRRGEAIALKAPLKMLAPLLFCIFPVVGILVGAPIFLDFISNNPIQAMK